MTPNGASITTTNPLVSAALHELCDCWPESVVFDELLGRVARRVEVDTLAEVVVQQLRGVVLEAYLGQLVLLHGCAMPARARASECPSAGALSRAQCRARSTVLTTLLGTNCTIDNDLGQQLLPRLDGQRDRDTLASELAIERAAIDETLTGLARQGLLSS